MASQCNDFISKWFPIGCQNKESWVTIFTVASFGLIMYAALFARYKKDKMIMANMIYFTILVALSIIFFGALSVSKNDSTRNKIGMAGTAIKIIALIVLFFFVYETVRPPNADKFTNTLFGRNNKNDENKKRMN
jgi:chromate transport protein ChrA